MGLDLDQARRQAKELVRAARSGDVQALSRFRADRPPRLADAQAAVARDLGFRSWPALVMGLLQTAVEAGDVERLGTLMAHGASVRGSDLLLYARDPEVTALLIKGGARLDVRDADGLTPYSRAARFRSETNLRLLAEAGAGGELDPGAEWVGAVVRGDLDRADRVKAVHPELALRWNDCEQLPRWASAGDDQVVARLLEAGIPIESRGAAGGHRSSLRRALGPVNHAAAAAGARRGRHSARRASRPSGRAGVDRPGLDGLGLTECDGGV